MFNKYYIQNKGESLAVKSLFKKITKYWLIIALVLQPILDIVAYFNFSTYITPISFVFRTLILAFILIFTFYHSKTKKKYILCVLPFLIFSLLHVLNSYRVGYLSVFDDIRYLIIVMQMPILTIAFINYTKEHDEYLNQFKIGLILNLLIIFLSFIISILSGNFNYTYDNYGFTGWFTSPNTQSMILVMVVPLAAFFLSKSKRTSVYILANLTPFILLFLNGTKACYITLIITLIILLYSSIVYEKSKDRIFRISISIFCFILLIFLNNYSFTSKRINIVDNNKKELKEITKNKDISKMSKEELVEFLDENYYWKELIDKYGEEVILDKVKNHLTEEDLVDNRYRKRVYAEIINDDSDLLTKIVGFEFSKIGKLGMDLENDLTAIFYYYGYLGFSIYIIFILYFIFILIKMFFKNTKIILDGEYVLYGLVIILSIVGSEYTGALLRKSNANIYFSVLLTLIYFKSKVSTIKLKKNKITFLLLHLGYGGIESSTINISNELSKKYNIELVSFYHLTNI